MLIDLMVGDSFASDKKFIPSIMLRLCLVMPYGVGEMKRRSMAGDETNKKVKVSN
jgi:hypothetical protein